MEINRDTFEAANDHVPQRCKLCFGRMIFKGVGEYQCEECGYLDYDDYGKVRNYVEKKYRRKSHGGRTGYRCQPAYNPQDAAGRTIYADGGFQRCAAL